MAQFLLGLCATFYLGGSLAFSADLPRTARWPDTPLARAEVLAILQSLNNALLTQDSATLVLDDWCARHQLAKPDDRVVAERVRGQDKAINPAQRTLLRVNAQEPVRYRRVRLRCGARILSEADNWYVPARLTPAMNETLETTDIPFGRVVLPLNFHRERLGARLLWAPLPENWDVNPVKMVTNANGRLDIPKHVIEHRAILALPNDTPISLVHEIYTDQVLAFPPPRFVAVPASSQGRSQPPLTSGTAGSKVGKSRCFYSQDQYETADGC